MELKVKNYVIREGKTLTYTVKELDNEDIINMISSLLRANYLFDYHSNAKSNVLSFYVRTIDDFNNIKKIWKKGVK